MVKANPKADEYISNAPAEQQAAMKWIRKLMRTKLSSAADERCQNGMIVYGLEKRWLSGFGSRKKCVMFYVMDSKLLDGHQERLGKLRTGKSCVEFRETASLGIKGLKGWAEEAIEEIRRSL